MNRPATDKYKLTIQPGVYHVFGFGEVDLRDLTMARADQLYKKGFPYLKEKPVKKEPPKAPEVKKIPKKKTKKN